MAADRSPEDAACPACGEPVGVRATYCMHCGRDLPDRADYDDVTGESDGGETLLTRLRPGATTDREESVPGTSETIEWETSDGGRAGRSVDAGTATTRTGPGVPSGTGTDGPRLLPVVGGVDAPGRAGRFLAALAGLGITGTGAFGLSLPAAGALLAVAAWVGATVSVARTRSAFDAMRYGSSLLMVTLIFVSFTFAFGSGGGLAPAAFSLVPTTIAALLVGGAGRTTPAPSG